jgi:DNA-binding LytR/AlgR family response regulator
MIISCIIVDDENLAVQHLTKNIAKIPFLRLEASFTDPRAAIEYLENHSIDLIFLDIEMPNFPIGGLDFVRIVGETQRYIFTTAYSEYALQGYELNAIDFLHKPFSFERFSKAINKARQILSLSSAGIDGDPDFIFMKLEGKMQPIKLEDIHFLKSDRNYISIYTATERLTALMTLSEIEAKLPRKNFARVHKSNIVSFSKVIAVEKDHVEVRCDRKTWRIPLGDTYKKPFLQAIEQRTFRKR